RACRRSCPRSRRPSPPTSCSSTSWRRAMSPGFPLPDRLVIVGAGPMGREHVRAAAACGLGPERIQVITRRTGGVEALDEPPAAAVVAVGIPELAGVAEALVELGCPYVLLEKPGALARGDLARLHGRSE